MSKLTVIIPLLKPVEELNTCIDSIAEQNLQNIDVLIVKDFEDENTTNQIDTIISKYSNKFVIKQVMLEEGHGICAARNYGVYVTKSEYVLFMEPEDSLEKGTLSAMLEAVPNLPVPLVYTRVKPLHCLVSGYHEEYEEECKLLFETDPDKLNQRPPIDQVLAAFDSDPRTYMVALRDNLEDFSVLGCMFHRSFLRENDILFSEDISFYPDAPFICKVLINADKTERVQDGAYIRRNGTFRYEVEKTADWKQRLEDYMTCYDLAYSYCISDIKMMLLVQETMCTHYVNVIVRLLYKSKDENFSEQIFRTFAKQMKRVDHRVVKSFDSAERKHLKLLLAGNLKDATDYMEVFIKKRKRQLFFKKKTVFMSTVAEKLFGNMDIADRYIVFESGHGQRYFGDPKYIYRYLQEHYPGEYKCIWVTNNRALADRIDGKCVTVKQYSLRYFYYILRSKYWIKDTRQPIWWYKSSEQVYISTWLGTPMQKIFLDKQAFLEGDALMRRGLKAQVAQWDALISGNPYTTEHLQSAFGLPSDKILEIGNPRWDYLVEGDIEHKKTQMKAEMNLPLDKKVILYAPVWREKEERDVDGFYKMQLGLHRLKEQLSDQYIIMVRMHDHIIDQVVLDKALEGFVYDLSLYDDIQELLLISDVLITDYSSIVFDYACMKRPIFFYLYDREEMKKDQNHFYFDFQSEHLPGPVCHTTQEISDYLKDMSKWHEQYDESLNQFHEVFCSMAGGSTERLARAMFTEMEDIFEYEDREKEIQLEQQRQVAAVEEAAKQITNQETQMLDDSEESNMDQADEDRNASMSEEEPGELPMSE